jgi:23S rRNA (uracil1939-C5)-methyltransferase
VTERLVVARVGHRGDGIADTPAGAVFVPYALPGETVDVEADASDRERRRLVRVAVASADRVVPICPHFGACGGCALQHWEAAAYRAWKRELVITALRQAGVDAPVDDLIDAHGEGRRRVVLHASRGSGELRVGFAMQRAHELVAIQQCPVLAPSLAGALPAARAIAETLRSAKPLDIQITATDTGLDVDVRGSGPLPPERLGALAQLAERHKLARVTRHGELVIQRTTPVVRMGRARVELPPGAFLQATGEGEAVLSRLVEAETQGVGKIADLFCGVGPFALRLAERARVTAVDSDAGAVTALRRAADATSGLKPVVAEARDLFRRPLLAAELKHFDAVVFDPPRQGAAMQAQALAQSKVPVVIGVSCNPATFARDAATLVAGGYKLAGVTPVDQFRYSAHVELVARFER